jgi:hypothetical protein
MLYNGEDERIRVVTNPGGVGLTDTRIYIYDLDHRIVGEYGLGGVVDTRAEYIWTLPEVGASGPTGGDDGLGGLHAFSSRRLQPTLTRGRQRMPIGLVTVSPWRPMFGRMWNR